MAYGNWAGRVYRGKERMPRWEDATPYKELTEESGYCQAFYPDLLPFHAVLGQQKMRLCGYKDGAILLFDGEEVDTRPFVTQWDDCGTMLAMTGQLEGYNFEARRDGDGVIHLELIEPDGTK